MQPIRDQIRCGRHSGFSWCCILWYITGWRLILTLFSDASYKWGMNTYHKLLDQYQPRTKMRYLHTGFNADYTAVTSYKIKEINDWGMIPCPFHLFTRQRRVVLACFCAPWDAELKARALREHPELVETE